MVSRGKTGGWLKGGVGGGCTSVLALKQVLRGVYLRGENKFCLRIWKNYAWSETVMMRDKMSKNAVEMRDALAKQHEAVTRDPSTKIWRVPSTADSETTEEVLIKKINLKKMTLLESVSRYWFRSECYCCEFCCIECFFCSCCWCCCCGWWCFICCCYCYYCCVSYCHSLLLLF